MPSALHPDCDRARPQPGTHAPRPARGELVGCTNAPLPAEVWCNPDDTAAFLADGIVVNGVRCRVQVVDRLAYADQLRITEAA